MLKKGTGLNASIAILGFVITALIKQSSSAAILILLVSVSAYAQGTIDKYGNFHPTEEQLAQSKRMGELLQHPTTFISLRLLSQRRDGLKEEPSTTPSAYTVGQRINFELFLTQNSAEDIPLMGSWWPYCQYRPSLVRDGDIVPYAKSAQSAVENPEKECNTGSMAFSTIPPGREILSNYVNLEDWYESPLKPGRYQLIVKKRFTRNGDWVESNLVTFDVVPRPDLTQGAGQPGASSPTQEEIIAANKRRIEQLKHPTFITLRLASARRDSTNEEPSTTPSPYTPDQWMNFELFITQNSTENLVLTSSTGDIYQQNRLILIRDGDIVPYRGEVQRQVETAGRDIPYGSARSRTLEPGREYRLGLFALDSWYDSPLKPGHYQLTIRRQFAFDGDWIESNPVTFDVVPQPAASPVPEKFSLQNNLIQSPTITVDIANQNSGEPYRLGPEVRIKVTANNETDQRLMIAVINEYAQNRPQLFRSGKLVPYRSGISKLAHSNEDEIDLPRVGRTDYIQVQPFSSAVIQVLDLKDWYGRLEPGSYRLTNRYRFTIGGPWSADSKAMSFEVAR